jgi:signal transduction histidine kinase
MRKSQLYSLAFGFSLLVLLSFSLLLYNSINSFSEYASLVERTQLVLNNLQRIQAYVIDAETGQRGFLLTRDSVLLDPLLKASTEIPAQLDSLASRTSDYPNQKKFLDTLKAVIWDRLHVLEETINRSSLYNDEMLNARLMEDKDRMDNFRRVIEQATLQEQALLEIRAKKKSEFERITPSYFKVIISITAIISLISFVLLMQELRERTAAQALLESRYHALNRSNAELQQIAHVTSHDLQEPLRKIRTFCDALVYKFKRTLPDEVTQILDRIDRNAHRMKDLVADLSAFTSLSTPDGNRTTTDLNTILAAVRLSLAPEIQKTGASVESDELPIINGYPQQLQILFKELLSNSMKFARADVEPVITISCKLTDSSPRESSHSPREYLVVRFADNGIGFEDAYHVKIFVLFQKLHGQESPYEGKGLGLSLCQRIMTNHEGFITASGKLNEGATFNLYFPLSLVAGKLPAYSRAAPSAGGPADG